MSLLKAALESSPVGTPFKVRMEPYLVESICELSRLVRDKGASNSDISGLLFGSVEPGTRSIEALKTFVDVGQHSELARRQRWEKAYKTTCEEAKNDPELSQLDIVGWFSFRTGSGLLNSDVVFHNQHFRNAEDLALIIWREGPSQITTEVYSKSDNDTLTAEDYRWGSVRLSADIRHMRESVELAMRTKLVNEDPFMQAYQEEEPSSHLGSLKRLFGFLYKDKDEPLNSDIKGLITDGRTRGSEPATNPQVYFNPYADALVPRKRSAKQETERGTPEPMVAAQLMGHPVGQSANGSGLGTAPARMSEPLTVGDTDAPVTLPPNQPLDLGHIGRTPRSGRAVTDEISGLPMLLRPPAPRTSTQWPWVIALFMVCSTLVFGVLAIAGLQSDNGRFGQAFQSLFPGTELNLRVRNEDDRLRLSWNQRNKAVASANDATLQIVDGQVRRDIRLDGREVANGSVLYRPLTNDVTFRLEVHGEQDAASGSVRILDGLSSRQSTLDVSAPVVPAPGVSNLNPTAQASIATPLSPAEPPATGRSTEPLTGVVPPATVPTTRLLVRSPSQKTSSAALEKPHYETPDNIGTIQPPGTSKINGWDPAPAKEKTPDFVPSRALTRAMPNMRSIPPGTIPKRTKVRVQVEVDQTGRVTFARIISIGVNSKVSTAALDAARQWTFDPAKSNGQHVTSEHTIVFDFPAR